MTHAKEPWNENADTIFNADRSAIAAMCLPNKSGNSRRIVACVNACAGIPTEVIDNFIVSGNLFAKQGQDWLELEQQRNELLELLKAIQEGPEFTPEFCQRIDATIERIEAAK